MQIEMKNPADLLAYENNARTHSDEQIKQIANSIKNFGFNDPIEISPDGTIISGHARALAALKLGLNEVPTVTLAGMDENARKAYILAANRTALNAGWDVELLKIELTDLDADEFDLTLTGFTDEEIESYLNPEILNSGLADEDDEGELPDDPVTKLGDVWICGNHRVACGDSTNLHDVEKLTKGEISDLGFCDPPYNLNFKYETYKDNKTEKEYEEFSHLWFSNLKIVSECQIVTLGTKNIPLMSRLSDVAGVACWVKKNWVTRCHIANLQQWEPIFFYGNFKGRIRVSDLFEVNRVIQKDVGDDHSCPKQIELIVDILKHYSKKLVIDLFGGSGTTLIACEKLGRRCLTQELDPRYVDVIVRRWEKFTGQKAILESTGEEFDV